MAPVNRYKAAASASPSAQKWRANCMVSAPISKPMLINDTIPSSVAAIKSGQLVVKIDTGNLKKTMPKLMVMTTDTVPVASRARPRPIK